MSRRRLQSALGLLLALSCATGVTAQETGDDRDALPTERARVVLPRIDRAPELDEFLDMKPPPDLAEQMLRVTGFTQREPNDGLPASQKTEAYLGYDDQYLYGVFLAFDDEPEKVRARWSRRERTRGDEIVEIQVDTYNDERRAFTFICNPFGIQTDALWTEGQGFDFAWDTVWQSSGKLTDRGYVVWMAIPFKSLRFYPEDDQTWGLVLVRDIPRNNESSFWPRVSNRIQGRLNQAGTMSGLEGISPGRNIWLIPYVSARRFRLLESDPAGFVRESFEADVGADAKFVIKDSLALDITLNPDFSQVESDQPQVTANQRFEVFFPERRPFFLENAQFFETEFNLLFTRRIRDPRVGGRLTGKVGKYAIGALLIDDEAPGEVALPGSALEGERARFGVLRVARDIGEQNTLGFMFTDWALADGTNRVGAIDGRFRLNKNWVTSFQAAYSDSLEPALESPTDASESDQAYSLQFDREGRKYDAHIHYREVGPEFHTEAGFIRRKDIKDFHMRHAYTFWPEGEHLISWGPSVRLGQINDHTGLRLDNEIVPEISFELFGQTEFEASYRFGNERLRPEDFDTLTEPVDFSTNGYRLEFSTQILQWFSLDTGYSKGDGINFEPIEGEIPSAGDRENADFGLTLRLGRRAQLDTTFLYAKLHDGATGGEVFNNKITRVRLNYQFNRQLTLRLIVQHDLLESDPTLTSLDPEENVNVDLLMTYLVNPWTAVYVGYNTNYRDVSLVNGFGGSVVGPSDELTNNARQLFVKGSYLFRF